MPRFAANISMMFTELPFLDRISAASQHGFDAVEFLFPYAHAASEIAARLQANTIKNILFNMPPGDWDANERGIAALPGREDEFREGVQEAIAYAKVLQTPNLHAMAGLVSENMNSYSCRRTFMENLAYAAQQCAPYGINVLIEPINARDMPGYFLHSQDTAHSIVEEIGEPNLKVQMDFYHAQIMEGDVSMTFKNHRSRIGHIQIAGVPDRHEPDTGELNYEHVFKLLDDTGYDGWVGCEYRPAQETSQGLDWFRRWK